MSVGAPRHLREVGLPLVGSSSKWTREIFPPALGWTLAAVLLLYLITDGVWWRLYPNERLTLLITVTALGFYTSLRVLLRAGHPDYHLARTLLYVAHLIHLFVLILLAAFGLLALARGDASWFSMNYEQVSSPTSRGSRPPPRFDIRRHD